MTSGDDRIARLERQLAALIDRGDMLEADNLRLRDENAELRRRLGENSSNSGKPPSSDSPADRAARSKDAPTGRRPGGQPGHKPKRRERLPREQVTASTHCFPSACRRCGDALPQTKERDPLWHQVIDLPPASTARCGRWRRRRSPCSTSRPTARVPRSASGSRASRASW